MATTTRDIQAAIIDTTLELTFSNGNVIRLNANDMAPEMNDKAMMHGYKQKLVDAAAIARNPDTGATASIVDKYNAVLEVYNRLTAEEPEWNKNRGDGTGSGSAGLLFRALCRLYPTKTPEAIREYLDGKDKSQQAALRANPKIARIIDEIRAEKSGGVDSDELLNELED